MLESESLSMISLPDLSYPENNAIPLTCWQTIRLSEIWIPNNLLTNRRKPLNRETQGVFRTLEKRDQARKIESFSVYSDESETGDEKETEAAEKNIEKSENSSELKSFPGGSNISLSEILNSTTEADITNFEFKKNHKDADKELEPFQSIKKPKNTKKKKKNAKSVTLDKFLEDYEEEDYQEACANNYLQKLLISKNETSTDIPLRNNTEFPKLKPEIEFIHCDQTLKKHDIEFMHNLKQPDVTREEVDISETKIIESVPESAVGKIIIENIPSEVSEEDILQLLWGYGEIKVFSLEQDGAFLKASVEIDLICDIDWIPECLNGTEPFGASSRVLKCYKQIMD